MAKILLIGPKLFDDEKNIGGSTILMSFFEKYLIDNEIEFSFIESNKFNNVLLNYIYILVKYFSLVFKYDVVFVNAASKFLKFLSPILLILSKLFNKKYILRTFGGNIDIQINKSNSLGKRLIKFSFIYSDLIFVETKLMLEYVKKLTSKPIEWFPNCRNMPTTNSVKKNNKKLLFLSQVKKEKGVVEILEANKVLKSKFDTQVDIYGPIHDKTIELDASYKGVIKPKNVEKILSEYSFLILPSYWQGEGYPGIILEAFSLGIPVISTDYRAIPEIIDDGVNGFLIEVKNSDDLVKKVEFVIDGQFDYDRFSNNALNKFIDCYEYKNVHKQIIEITDNLL